MFRMTVQKRRAIWAYLFLFVPLVFFLYFRIGPTISAFNISLHEWNPLATEQTFVGFDNYKELWEDLQNARTPTHHAFVNTLKYVIIGMPLQLIIALAIALLLNEIRRFSVFFRAVYFIPFVTSTVAISWVWRWLYQPQYGFFNVMLSTLGLAQQPFLKSPNQSLYSILAVVVWQGLGFSVIIFLAGLKQVPQTYYEAAKIDGANRRQSFWRITMPMLNTTLVYLAVLQTISFLRMFAYVINMTTQGDGGPLNSTTTITLRVYREAFSSFNMGYAATLTVALFVMIMVITVLQLRVLSRAD
jgi:multiple sugar transport system permease protein